MTDKYSVILADPPWNHYNANNYWKAGDTRRKPRWAHYETLSYRDICKLPIGDLAATNAALFMWTCTPILPKTLSVLDAWGFRYATVGFTWVKLNRDGTPFAGLGAYTHQNIELCVIGIRGKMKPRDLHVRQVMMAPRREHSRKPDQQYGRIMRLFDGPYLELFARQQWPGWDVWGNQTNLFPAQPFLFDEGMAA
jgi:N6-adenosine-specific RNA methylase IME4